MSLAEAHRESRLDPFGQSGMGGRSESGARSYAANPESRDGTLQLSGGKDWKKP